MNSINLIGRLTSDPELRHLEEGKAVAKFVLAVDRPLSLETKGRLEAEGKPTADFLRIESWGKLAEHAGKYLRKGSQVGVTGRVTTGSYTKDDGSKVYTTEVRAHQIRFLSSREKASESADIEDDTQVENIPF